MQTHHGQKRKCRERSPPGRKDLQGGPHHHHPVRLASWESCAPCFCLSSHMSRAS